MTYHTFTGTRTTQPDPAALLSAMRTAVADATAFVWQIGNSYAVLKSTDWSAGDLTAAQNAIETAPDWTPQREAQNQIDNWPIVWKALALTLLDQINILRANDSLAAVTPTQAIAAIRAKAATL